MHNLTPRQIVAEIDDEMTPASLEALSAALSVRWPQWYPPFVLELTKMPNAVRPFWLPGGFLFASPRRAYEETMSYRRGQQFFSGAPSIDAAGPAWPAHPLPTQYIVVGETGEGAVLVDTSSQLPRLLWLDKEGYWRQPLIDFPAEGKTPAEVARAISK
jgi:hypothetical protein